MPGQVDNAEGAVVEPLLACRIPHVQRDWLRNTSDLEILFLDEVDGKCLLVNPSEDPFAEPPD